MSVSSAKSASPNSTSTPATLGQRMLDGFYNALGNDNVRWVVLFIFVLLSYVYILYQSFSKVDLNNPEQVELAYLINPSRGGYRVVRGDPTSPPLFQWDGWELAILIGIALLTLGLGYKLIWQNEKNTPLYIRIIEFLLAWTHLVVILWILPVNPFHKRILYNVRSATATVCNDSLKELWLAFLFIVLLPLPGSRSFGERMTWLALKLGVFYIVQNLLLGSPHYTVESYTEDKILPENASTLLGYGLIVVLMMALMIWENAYSWETTPWKDMSYSQQRNRLGGFVGGVGSVVILMVVLFMVFRKSSSVSPSPTTPMLS